MSPRGPPGVVVNDDWDALGMRASGSDSVSFEEVSLPRSALRGGFPVGDAVEYMERNLAAGLFHAAAAIGVAESAQASIVSGLAARDEVDPHAQMLAAESSIDLSACRAVLSRAAVLIEDHHERNPTSRGTPRELTELFGEAQSTKLFIGEASFRIVDRALAMSGGAGYLNGSPLARAYRDVRALPFMHPLGANRGYAFLGQLAAGREPSLH
jgi:alkylation response protein AidB-like acyl-CoA dehydrogenase